MNEENHKYLNTDERRLEIAAAARALIVEKGVEGLRTREVAARVGINISTLHYHVASKEELLSLVTDTMRDEFIARSKCIDGTALDALGRLRLEIDEYKQLMLEKPDLLQLFEELGKRGRVDPAIEPKIRDMRIGWHRRFTTILTEGREAGLLRASLDPEAAAHMIIGALVSFQYKPRHLLPLFDSVADEIIRSVIAI